jgi:hypothetical protein
MSVPWLNCWVDCWEGAALRSRLRGEPSSLGAMLDFYLASVTVAPANRKRSARSQ